MRTEREKKEMISRASRKGPFMGMGEEEEEAASRMAKNSTDSSPGMRSELRGKLYSKG